MAELIPSGKASVAVDRGVVIDLFYASLRRERHGQPDHGEPPLSAEELSQIQRLLARVRERAGQAPSPWSMPAPSPASAEDRRAPDGWARDHA